MDAETRARVIGEAQYRDLTLDRAAVNAETRTVDLAFSSDKPYQRWWGIEILSHDAGMVHMGRLADGAALLLNHDLNSQIGVIERCSIDADNVGRATVRFSKSEAGEEVFRDVQDGIRRKTSVGYMVHNMEEIKPENMDEALKNLCAGEGLKAYRCEWEPYEISIVSVPADVSVGVGRSKEVTPQPAKGEETITINTRGAKMDEVKTPSPEELARIQADAVKADRERTAEIRAYAKRFVGRVAKVDELAEKAEREGWSVAQMKGAVADQVADGKPIESPDSEIGLTKKELEKFSLRNLILSVGDRPTEKAEFERECCNATAKKLGMTPKGFAIPFDVQMSGRDHPDFKQFFKSGRRDLVTTSSASADYLVADNLVASSFIELLRNKMVMKEAGVRQLSGLVGNVLIPRQLTAGTAVWCTEATGINSESTQTFDQLSLVPNEVGAYTEISRKLLQQATPGVEGLVQSDLATVLALARDAAILHGAGTAEPTGIANTSSIGSFTGAGLTWDDVVEAEGDVAGNNADVRTMSYITTPAVVSILKTRPKQAGYPVFLMDNDGTMNGYRVFRTAQVTAGYMFFGDFSQVIEAEWGVLDMLVNPYILDKEGLIRIVAYQSVDVGVRHAGAFSMASGVS